MNRPSLRRVAQLFVLSATIGLVACSDLATAPSRPVVRTSRAAKDSTPISGDSTLCRSGYLIFEGRILCNDEH